MAWSWTLVAITAAFAAAFVFRAALYLSHGPRMVAWLVLSVIVAGSPCIVPLSAKLPRLAAALFAIAMLVKLYDIHSQATLAKELSLSEYVLYLTNWLWLVLRRPPQSVGAARDVQRLLIAGPAAVAAISVCVAVFLLDWSRWPFWIEHSIKLIVLVVSIWLSTNCTAFVWRLLGGAALDPIGQIGGARTPAEFWRRWNRPAQQFFEEYAYRRFAASGHRGRALLVTFVISGVVHEYVFSVAAGHIQGWQLLFFSSHGIASLATTRLRPSGWWAIAFTATTIVFNVLMAALFLKSIDAVVPFYSPRLYP